MDAASAVGRVQELLKQGSYPDAMLKDAERLLLSWLMFSSEMLFVERIGDAYEEGTRADDFLKRFKKLERQLKQYRR